MTLDLSQPNESLDAFTIQHIFFSIKIALESFQEGSKTKREGNRSVALEIWNPERSLGKRVWPASPWSEIQKGIRRGFQVSVPDHSPEV